MNLAGIMIGAALVVLPVVVTRRRERGSISAMATKPNISHEKDAAGLIGKQMDIKYYGVTAKIKPRGFLELVPRMGNRGDDYEVALEKYVAEGGKIAPPFLSIEVPDEWLDGNFSRPARVVGHEGRHRTTYVGRSFGEHPIDVDLVFRGETLPGSFSFGGREVRRRHLSKAWLDALNRGLYEEEWEGSRRLRTNAFDFSESGFK